MTIVLDGPERIPAAFAIIDEVTADRGLVTSELVAATLGGCRSAETPGLTPRLLAAHRAAPCTAVTRASTAIRAISM